ncbi:MAG: hypothetical protein ACLQLT_13435 [Methylovirgula sp.]
MFFLIRCVFWLTVVFSTIFNTDHGPMAPARQVESPRQAQAMRQDRPAEGPSAESMGQTAQAWVSATIQRFWNKATGGCAEAPAQCVAIAARLSDFARHHPFNAQATAEKWAQAAPAPVETTKILAARAPLADVPLPPLRPQHLRLPDKPVAARSAHDRSAARERSSQS